MDGFISTFLANFTEDLYVASTLEITISSFSLNQTEVKCLTRGLSNDTIVVDVDFSSKCTCSRIELFTY
jgi:hypothetical protein